MTLTLRAVFLCSIVLFSISKGVQSEEVSRSTVSPQQVYDYFHRTSPRDISIRVLNAADQLSKGVIDLDAFNLMPSEWMPPAPTNVQMQPIQVAECDQGSIVATPVFKSLLTAKQVLIKFKDREGRYPFWDACKKVSTSPYGVWTYQYYDWSDVEFKHIGPLSMFIYMVSVPGTNYQLHSYYVSDRYSVDYLNEKAEAWFKAWRHTRDEHEALIQ